MQSGNALQQMGQELRLATETSRQTASEHVTLFFVILAASVALFSVSSAVLQKS
jgi:hypothetical protein